MINPPMADDDSLIIHQAMRSNTRAKAFDNSSVGDLKRHMNFLKVDRDFQALRDLHATYLSDPEQGHFAVALGISRSFNLHAVRVYSEFAPEISQQIINLGCHLYQRDSVVGEMQMESLLFDVFTAETLELLSDVQHMEWFPAEFQQMLMEYPGSERVLRDLEAFEVQDLGDVVECYRKTPVRCLKVLHEMSRPERIKALRGVGDFQMAEIVAKFDLLSVADLDEVESEVLRCAIAERDLL